MEGRPATIEDIQLLNVHGIASDFAQLDYSTIYYMNQILQDDNDPFGQLEVLKLYVKIHQHSNTCYIDSKLFDATVRLVCNCLISIDNVQAIVPALNLFKSTIERNDTIDFDRYKDVLHLVEVILYLDWSGPVEQQSALGCIEAMLHKFGKETSQFIVRSPTMLTRMLGLAVADPKSILLILVNLIEQIDRSLNGQLFMKLLRTKTFGFILCQGLWSSSLYTNFQALRLVHVLAKASLASFKWLLSKNDIIEKVVEALSTPNIEISSTALDIIELIRLPPKDCIKHLLNNLTFVMMCGEAGYSFDLKLKTANRILAAIKGYMEIVEPAEFLPYFDTDYIIRVPDILYDEEILAYSIRAGTLSKARSQTLLAEYRRNEALRCLGRKRSDHITIHATEMIQIAKKSKLSYPEMEALATAIHKMVYDEETSSDEVFLNYNDLDHLEYMRKTEKDKDKEATVVVSIANPVINVNVEELDASSFPSFPVPIQRTSSWASYNPSNGYCGSFDLSNPIIEELDYFPNSSDSFVDHPSYFNDDTYEDGK